MSQQSAGIKPDKEILWSSHKGDPHSEEKSRSKDSQASQAKGKQAPTTENPANRIPHQVEYFFWKWEANDMGGECRFT